MPVLGEIQKALEIGKCPSRPWQGYIWHACIDCGKQRWVKLLHGYPRYPLCHSCRNKVLQTGQFREHTRGWKGGLIYDDGYVFVYMPEHPHAKSSGYVKRARLVLEEKLGRYLLPGMEPHHENEIKDDDRPENLMEISHGEHPTLHATMRRWNKFKGGSCLCLVLEPLSASP